MATFTVYANAMLALTTKQIDLAADPFSMILASSSYAPNTETDTTYASIAAHEIPAGQGYTTGGVQLTGMADDLAGDVLTFSTLPALWNLFSATFRYAVIIHRVATDLLLCFADCSGGGSITGQGGVLSIAPNAAGIFTLTHLP